MDVGMIRTVETFVAHPPVVHYQLPAPADLNGERLRAELLAAGIPDYTAEIELPKKLTAKLAAAGLKAGPAVPRTQVTFYPPDLLDIAIPYDVDTDHSEIVAKVVRAHKGTKHADEVALRKFTDGVTDAARRMVEGGKVTDQERDLVTTVLVQQKFL